MHKIVNIFWGVVGGTRVLRRIRCQTSVGEKMKHCLRKNERRLSYRLFLFSKCVFLFHVRQPSPFTREVSGGTGQGDISYK